MGLPLAIPSRMKIWMLFLLLPVGCGAPSNGIKDWVLQLELPRAISGDSARQRAFLDRVVKVEVKVDTPSGEKKEYYATSGHFKEIRLTDLELSAKGSYSVSALVWDRTRDGSPRSTPCSAAERVISKGDLEDKEHVLTLKLRMKVDEREYY